MVEAILGWLKLLQGVMFFVSFVDGDFLFCDGGGADIFPEA